MAYVDQEMSGNRVIALIIVALIHIAVGYVLVTGLAYSAVQSVVERVTTVDIDEPEPEPEEEPPPPPEDIPEVVPPPFVPPPAVVVNREAPVQRSTETITDNTEVVRSAVVNCPGGGTAANLASCAPQMQQCAFGGPVPAGQACAEPPPKFTPKGPEPRGNPGRWASARDYPSRALREEREGTTRFTVRVGTNGRVESCSVTGSSGHRDLDDTTCKLIKRRGRFRPATNGDGNEVAQSWSSAVRWEIPQ